MPGMPASLSLLNGSLIEEVGRVPVSRLPRDAAAALRVLPTSVGFANNCSFCDAPPSTEVTVSPSLKPDVSGQRAYAVIYKHEY